MCSVRPMPQSSGCALWRSRMPSSTKTLGPVRQGSGVVIGGDGLVLTIGYLILEAENVELHLAACTHDPGARRRVRRGHGFGLVQALAPLKLPPAQLGSARSASSDEPLMIASGGDNGDVSIARMVSQARVLRLLGIPHRWCAVHVAAAYRSQRRCAVQRPRRVARHRVADRHGRDGRQPPALTGQHVRSGRPAQADPRRAARARHRRARASAHGWASIASNTTARCA